MKFDSLLITVIWSKSKLGKRVPMWRTFALAMKKCYNLSRDAFLRHLHCHQRIITIYLHTIDMRSRGKFQCFVQSSYSPLSLSSSYLCFTSTGYQKNNYSVSRKKRPPPYVKYSDTHNTKQKSLKITEDTLLTSIWTFCAKLVSSVSGSRYYYLLSATHQKCNFPNETISVKSNEQSAKKSRLQMVFKMSTSAITRSRRRVRCW